MPVREPQEAAELMVAQGDAARYEMAASAGRSALQGAMKDGAAPLPGHLLQERIVQPLGGYTQPPAPKIWRHTAAELVLTCRIARSD